MATFSLSLCGSLHEILWYVLVKIGVITLKSLRN